MGVKAHRIEQLSQKPVPSCQLLRRGKVHAGLAIGGTKLPERHPDGLPRRAAYPDPAIQTFPQQRVVGRTKRALARDAGLAQRYGQNVGGGTRIKAIGHAER